MLDPNLIDDIRKIAVTRDIQHLMDYPAVFAEYIFRDESREQILDDATKRYTLTLSNEQQDAFAREGEAILELNKTDPDAARERSADIIHTVYTWYNETLATRLDEDPLDKYGRVKKAVALVLTQQIMDESIRSIDPGLDE